MSEPINYAQTIYRLQLLLIAGLEVVYVISLGINLLKVIDLSDAYLYVYYTRHIIGVNPKPKAY